MNMQLKNRYERSYNTRFLGYEDRSDGCFVGSMYTGVDGPVAAIDRVKVVAPVSIFAFTPEALRELFPNPLDGFSWQIAESFQLEGVFFKTEAANRALQFSIELTIVDPSRPVLLQIINALVHLIDKKLLRCSAKTVKGKRRAARRIMKYFRVAAVETRWDFPAESVMGLYMERLARPFMSETNEGGWHADFTAWGKEGHSVHNRGYHLRAYAKETYSFTRFEIILFSKILNELDADELLKFRPHRIVAMLWTIHRGVLMQMRQGRKIAVGTVDAIMAAIHRPVHFNRLVKARGLQPSDVMRMLLLCQQNRTM